MDRIYACFVSVALFSILVLPLDALSPREMRLERISYHKVTFSWQIPDTSSQVAYYKIFRNGTELATTTSLTYTDAQVQPGTKYYYKVLAVFVGGGDSEFSIELPVSTLKSSSVENNHVIENIVDSFHETPKSTLMQFPSFLQSRLVLKLCLEIMFPFL